MNKTLSKTFWWILSLSMTLIMSLVGMVYANLVKSIDNKANKETVELMQKDLSDVKKGINDLIKMHIEHGYK